MSSKRLGDDLLVKSKEITMKIPKPKSNFKTLEAGNHFAICVGLIDLGTHKKEFKGVVKYSREIRLCFETVTAKAIFNEEKGEQPFYLTKDFSLSMYPQSSLRLFLESWRSKKFEEKDLDDYDLKGVLEKTCLLNTVINSNKDGSREYSNIVSATPVPKEMAKEVKPVNPILYFDLENPDWNVFAGLPEFLQNKIKESPEYKKAAVGDEDQGVF